jgi:hypothetical protein
VSSTDGANYWAWVALTAVLPVLLQKWDLTHLRHIMAAIYVRDVDESLVLCLSFIRSVNNLHKVPLHGWVRRYLSGAPIGKGSFNAMRLPQSRQRQYRPRSSLHGPELRWKPAQIRSRKMATALDSVAATTSGNRVQGSLPAKLAPMCCSADMVYGCYTC